MEKKKSIAKLGVSALLAVTLAGTSAPMIPMQVFANVSEPPAEGESATEKTSKEILDERTEAYEKAKALYEQAKKSTEDEKAVLAALEQAYEAAGLSSSDLYKAFDELQKKNIEEISGQIEELDKQIEAQKTNLDSAQAEKDKAQSDLDTKNAEADELNRDIDATKAKLDVATDNAAAIEQAERDIETLETKKADAESRLNEVNAELNNANSTVKSLEDKKDKAAADLDAVRSEKSDAQSQLENKQAELAQAESDKAENDEEVASLKNQIEDAKSELAKRENEYDAAKKAYEDASAEYDRLSKLVDEKNALEKELAELNGKLDDAKAVRDAKQAELDAKNLTVKDLNEEIQTLDTEYNDLLQQKAALEKEISDSEAKRDAKVAELNETKFAYEASLKDAQDLLARVGIDYVDELSNSYTYGEKMTIDEYWDWAINNVEKLKTAGLLDETDATNYRPSSFEQLKNNYYNAFTVENLNKAMDIIDRCNEIRHTDPISQEDADKYNKGVIETLYVGVSGMKYTALEAAQYHVNSDNLHLLFRDNAKSKGNGDAYISGGTSENLALGYSDPTKGWYEGEIEALRDKRAGKDIGNKVTGHAANILNPTKSVCSTTYDGSASGQNYYTSKTSGVTPMNITTDQFREGLSNMSNERHRAVDSINEEIASINKQIATEMDSDVIKNLQQKLAEVESSINTNREAQAGKSSEKTAAEAEVTAAETDVTKANADVAAAEKNVKDTETKLAKYATAESDAQAAQNTKSEKSASLNKAEENRDNAKGTLDNLQSSCDALIAQSAELQNTVDGINSEITDLNAKIDELGNNEKNASDKLESIKSELAEANKELDAVKSEYDELNKNISETDTNIADKTTELDHLKATDKKQFEDKLAELTEQMDALNTAIDELKDTIANSEASIKQANDKINEASEEKSALDESKKNLKAQTIDSEDLSPELKEIADNYNAKVTEEQAIADQKQVVEAAEAEEQAAKEAMDKSEIEMNAARAIYEAEQGPQNAIRIKGDTRYDTSRSTADALKKSQGIEKFNTIIVATGKNFADSLAGSYLASVRGNAPIISIDPAEGTQQDKTIDYINNNLAEGGEVIILGGNVAVPTSIDSRFNGKVSRIAGNTRYETNVMILEEAGLSSADELLVSTGITFADSLSASATGKPILLVDKKMSATQSNFIEKYFKGSDKKITVLGGKSAVSDEVYRSLSTFNSTIKRIAGATRYDTSRLIANEYFGNAKHAVIAYGMNFPDGLSGGPLAMQLGAPLILANDSTDVAKLLSGYTKTFSIKTGYILGGVKLVTDEAAKIILDCLEIVDYE